MTTPVAYRNLAAECRAVEHGHNCRLAPDGRSFLVVSESEPGVTRHVTAEGRGGYVAVTCDCPAGRGVLAPIGLGINVCWHGASACRRLEREGLASFDGERWITTPKAEKPSPVIADEDVFRGLP